MDDEPIRCVFVFSSAEYGRASRCFYRSTGAFWKWLGIVLLVFTLPILFPGNPDDQGAAFKAMSAGMKMFINLLPVALFIIFLTLFILGWGWWAFRRSATYNQEMEYTLGEERIHLKNAVMDLTVKWDILVRVAENPSGFLLIQKGKRSFHWLPKHGFAGTTQIDRCRELLRQQVKDAKWLFPAQ